jgi:cob(I)alamin adenosyltransferase
MKIYTKTGDSGTTGLYGGSRVSKDSPRITAYGEIDELNALIGVVRAESPHEPVRQALIAIQRTLFTVGAQLASPGVDPNIECITAKEVSFLERQMDVMGESLPQLKHFILPGGGKTAAFLHLARTVCRRAERHIVQLSKTQGEVVEPWLLIYINRLSDFLFVLARLGNQLEGLEEIPWNPKKLSRSED